MSRLLCSLCPVFVQARRSVRNFRVFLGFRSAEPVFVHFAVLFVAHGGGFGEEVLVVEFAQCDSIVVEVQVVAFEDLSAVLAPVLGVALFVVG